MTDLMKIEEIKRMLGRDASKFDEETLLTFLRSAGNAILRKAFPFHPDEKIVPDQYGMLQCEIATYLINKMGAEGETAHNENGISRTYASAYVPDDMLKSVVPFAGVVM